MGNREDLLLGAKRCLYEKGYARTTARDIAAAAGTSLASIGYHYRSTEALLNAALLSAIEDWGNAMGIAAAAPDGMRAGSAEQFEAFWTRLLESFKTERPLLAASLEIVPLITHDPPMREAIAGGLEDARVGWARMFQGLDVAVDPVKARAVGSLYQALLSGMVVQWIADPEKVPSAAELTEALRIIAAAVAK